MAVTVSLLRRDLERSRNTVLEDYRFIEAWERGQIPCEPAAILRMRQLRRAAGAPRGDADEPRLPARRALPDRRR